MKYLACFLMGLLVAGSAAQADETASSGLSADIERLLKASGAVSYARKDAYGSGIQEMTLGYGKDGAPVVGIAVRTTKTYAEALTIIAVTPENGTYRIAAAEIPEVGTFHGKSQDLAKEALKDVTDKVFKDEKEARSLVDAFSGATQYKKAIYVSYAVMASKVIEELAAAPDWPRVELTP